MPVKDYYVYVLANRPRGAFYVGVTSDLKKRVWEHKSGTVAGFTRKYGIKTLVYYEIANDIREAIRREKRFKRWDRVWKVELIEENNPDWIDLYSEL